MTKLSEIRQWIARSSALINTAHEYHGRIAEVTLRIEHAQALSMPRVATRWKTELEFATTAFDYAMSQVHQLLGTNDPDEMESVLLRVQARHDEVVECEQRLYAAEAVWARMLYTSSVSYSAEELETHQRVVDRLRAEYNDALDQCRMAVPSET
jgi:hypothetical protein